MAMTIVGDIYTVAERALVQGYIASVWAVSSVVGPALGGVFAQFDAWRLIFFVNVPLCAIAAWMLIRRFREQTESRRHRIDYLGAALLTVALSGIILGVLEGGDAWAWLSVPSAICFGGGALALVAFAVDGAPGGRAGHRPAAHLTPADPHHDDRVAGDRRPADRHPRASRPPTWRDPSASSRCCRASPWPP